MAFKIYACVNTFCGMENLEQAMKLICLILIGSFLIVIPLVVVCYVESFFFSMNYSSFAASIAAFVLSIVVVLSLQLKVGLACHFFLNIIWWPVTFFYIINTLHVCIFYMIVKSPMLEPCPPEAIALLLIWMTNTLFLTSGMLVYWSMYVTLKEEQALREEEAALRDEQTGPLSGYAERNISSMNLLMYSEGWPLSIRLGKHRV